jgi:hypothetical protein
MSNVISISTREPIMQEQDNWLLIGVHLESRIEKGMTLDDAANSLILDGVDTVRVRDYLDRIGLKDSDRMKEVRELYTSEEQDIIQRWILYGW